MEKVDIAIVGAGVVGLAIAAKLSRPGRSVVVLEKNERHGMETSSRNSEVIHAGIYYPADSLKAKLCVRGNRLMYEICAVHGIKHRRTEKIIVADKPEELPVLEKLLKQGLANGVPGLKILTRAEVKKMESDVESAGGLLSETSGILDTEGLMLHLKNHAEDNGAMVVFNADVNGIRGVAGGYEVSSAGQETITAGNVINASGLGCEKVSALAGIDTAKAGYKLHFCKGEYFRVHKKMSVDMLIYPVPLEHSLGIHLTVDLAGQLRLGPNAYFVDKIDYSQDDMHKREFWESARRHLPKLQLEDLHPDTTGIRPKLQGPGGGFRDFIIRDESDKGLPGFINLVGIDSPGLTSAPAIAEMVETLI